MNGGGLDGAAVFCSWSGGKDSALALHKAARAGAEPRLLISMLTEGGERSRSHGLRRELLAAQAEAMGLPIRFGSATWAGYEAEFRRLAGEGAAAIGARTGVFGDIDLAEHREWVERVCGEAGLRAELPLWQQDRAAVVEELIEAGFEALVVAVRDDALPPRTLGRQLDRDLLAEVVAAGCDPAGEGGEFHTLVVDGPLFRRRLAVRLGERSLRDGVWFIDARV